MSDEGKTLYCIRHGESTFNEWRMKSLYNFSWVFVKDPMIIDAPLSKKGRRQAEKLRQQINSEELNKRVEVIISSPLSRAIETATMGFQDSDARLILDPSCREMLDTACDIGQQPDDLVQKFPHLASQITTLERSWWLNAEQKSVYDPITPITKANEVLPLRETPQDLDKRIYELMETISNMDEQHIAIVGHSSFFKRMLRMPRKLHNCEVCTVQASDIVLVQPRTQD